MSSRGGPQTRRGDLNRRCDLDCYNLALSFVVTSPLWRLFGLPRHLRCLAMTLRKYHSEEPTGDESTVLSC